MVIVLPINIFLRRRMEFPGFELKAPLLMLLGVMAISLTYSPNQPEATIHFVRMVVLVFFMYLTQVMIRLSPIRQHGDLFLGISRTRWSHNGSLAGSDGPISLAGRHGACPRRQRSQGYGHL